MVFQNLRSGDIPIGVSDYLTYTQLKAAAPELDGLWSIAPMPGVVREDGQVARWAPGASHAAVMFRASKKKEQAWEWPKWWTSAETQAAYGNEVEALFGAGYRWTLPTRGHRRFRGPKRNFRPSAISGDGLGYPTGARRIHARARTSFA